MKLIKIYEIGPESGGALSPEYGRDAPPVSHTSVLKKVGNKYPKWAAHPRIPYQPKFSSPSIN